MKKFHILFLLACSVMLYAYGETNDLPNKKEPEDANKKEDLPTQNEPVPDKIDTLDNTNNKDSSSFWPDAAGTSKPDIKEVDSKSKQNKNP